MSEFSEEEEVSVEPIQHNSAINVIDAKMEGNNLIITNETGQVTTFPFTDEALAQLTQVLPPAPSTETAGGSRRRKSKKQKAVKRRNKSHRRVRRR
jgi:hypothetical protein